MDLSRPDTLLSDSLCATASIARSYKVRLSPECRASQSSSLRRGPNNDKSPRSLPTYSDNQIQLFKSVLRLLARGMPNRIMPCIKVQLLAGTVPEPSTLRLQEHHLEP
jgi:hypothetical protein